MDKTIAKSLFAGMLAMSAGCVTGEDFVPPPPKPLTVIRTEPQKPTSESNAKLDANVVAPVVDKAPKRSSKGRDKKQPVPPATVRKVALVVQNHAAPGAEIPLMALTDALTAKLSGCGLQVINPYNAIGVNLNRTAAGEKMPEVSAMEIARKLKADGAITASVLEFLDSASDTTHQYSIRIVLNLADAWSGATVVEGETVEKSSPYYADDLVRRKKAKLLNDLMYAAAEECAKRLKNNPEVKTWRPTPPPPPKPLPPPPEPKRPILDKIVDKLSAEMLLSPQFVKNYEEQKEKDERIPIAVIGGMENESGHTEFDAGLKAAGERFRKKLFDSKLFDVKDDAILVNLAKRIVASGNSATENGDLMEALKQHGSPDFFVIGNLTHFADLDGTGYYKFRMTMHSLRTGKIAWEGIETITTNKETAE